MALAPRQGVAHVATC